MPADNRGCLGLEVAENLEAVHTIRQGLPTEVLDELLELGIASRKLIYELVVPRATADHRRKRGQSLTPEESERLLRVKRTARHALETFGDFTKAKSYLNKPLRRFESRSCLQMLDTDVGADLVEQQLTRIDHGIPG